MRILITGGAGYVGSHVCRLLREASIPHLAYDDLSTGHEDLLQGSPFIRGDIADSTALGAAFAQFKPDAVINLAALATLGGCAADPELTERTNIIGLQNVLDAMQQYGAKHLVHASSCAVYAPLSGPGLLSETSTIGPASLYGQSKWQGEEMIRASGLGHVMLRLFNVAGAHPAGGIGERHDPETHLVPLAIEAALGRRPALAIFGNDYPTPDGTAVRDYVHVLDVASAMLHSLQHMQKGGASMAVNLGSGIGTSVKELLQAVEKHVGKPVPATLSGRREGDTPYLVCDSTKLKAELGYSPRYCELDTVIATALQWHA